MVSIFSSYSWQESKYVYFFKFWTFPLSISEPLVFGKQRGSEASGGSQCTMGWGGGVHIAVGTRAKFEVHTGEWLLWCVSNQFTGVIGDLLGTAIFDLFAPPWPVSLVVINCWPLPPLDWLMESPSESMLCSHRHAHTHTQINTYIGIQQPPQYINISFSTSGTSTERSWFRSITACLVYRLRGYVLIPTMSHCHFDLTQGSSTGRYHTFVKYYLTPDISSIHL